MQKVMIFDLDDTLYDQLYGFEYAYYRHFGDSQIGVETLYRHFRMNGEALFEATQTGELSVSDMHVERISRAVADFDITLPVEKARAFQRDYEVGQQHITLSDTMQQLLSYLVAHQVKMGVLTNGESDRQRAKIKTLQLTKWIPDTHIFVSAELGASKPDAAVFQHVARALDLVPRETYMIGDHFENDILGAMAVGWQTIWLNRRHHVYGDEAKNPTFATMTEAGLFEVVRRIVN